MKKLLVIAGIAAVIYSCNSGGEKQAEGGDTAQTETPAATQNLASEKGLELIGASDCTTCHSIDKKMIGPAYTDVAKKYEATEETIDSLASKVINGGFGNWGSVPMTAHPDLSKDDAREMVKYILSLKNR